MMGECEQCGKVEHKAKMKNKRFCSIACVRLQASTTTSGTSATSATTTTTKSHILEEQEQQNIIDQNVNKNNNNNNNNNETNNNDLQQQQQQIIIAPVIAQQQNDVQQQQQQQQQLQQQQQYVTTTPNETSQIANWTVGDVCEFIKNLPGCCDYVDDFEQQEIDGQALLLLKENHLVNAMGMKLGPALKIVAKVEAMKEINNPNLVAVASVNSDKDVQ